MVMVMMMMMMTMTMTMMTTIMMMTMMMMILERFIAANNVTGNICDFTRCDTFPYSCL